MGGLLGALEEHSAGQPLPAHGRGSQWTDAEDGHRPRQDHRGRPRNHARQQRIIGYGEYHYQGRSGASGEWFIVGLAAQKQYLSLYVNAVEDGQHLLKRYVPRLGRVKAGSAKVSIRRLADVEMDVLLEMIAQAREVMAG